MKQITLIALLFLLLPCSKGQVMAPTLVQNYPPGVVSKLYEVTLNTLIPHETQIKLANILVARDKWVMDAVQKDGSLQVIKNGIDSFQVLFNAQFAKSDRVQYETYLHKGFIEGAAKTAVAALQSQYSIDTETAKGLYTMHRARQLASIKGYALIEGGQPLTDSVLQLLVRTDSLYNGYLIVAKGEGYFKDALQKMNDAKTVEKKTADCLHQKFVAHTFRHGNNYHQNFNMAMRYCVMDTVHFKVIYADSLEGVAQQQLKAELTDYRYRYNLNQRDVDSITPLVYNKVKQNLWLETRYPFGPTKDSLQTMNNETARLRINNKLLRIGFYSLSTSRIGRALHWYKRLGLRETQMDSLCAYELELDLQPYDPKVPFASLSPRRKTLFEFGALKLTLSPNQFDSLPFLQSIMPARNKAYINWMQMVETGFDKGQDSTKVNLALMHYYTNCLALAEKHRYMPQQYERLLNDAILNKPDILRRLDEALRASGQTRGAGNPVQEW